MGRRRDHCPNSRPRPSSFRDRHKVLISQYSLAKSDVRHVPLTINSRASFLSKLALRQADPEVESNS